jgi:hypothetical protein
MVGRIGYACPHCDRHYTRTSYLDNHLRKKHPAEYEKLPEQPDTWRRVAGSSAQAAPEASKAPHGPGCLTTDPMTSVDTALQGAELVRDVAKRLRNANAHTREKLARDLEGLAFGLQFLFNDLSATNYRDAIEKARKWDKLVEILPTIESFLKLAIEMEVKRVQARDQD